MVYEYAIGPECFQDIAYLAHIWPPGAFGVGWVLFHAGPVRAPLGVKYALIRLRSGRYVGIRKTELIPLPEDTQAFFAHLVAS